MYNKKVVKNPFKYKKLEYNLGRMVIRGAGYSSDGLLFRYKMAQISVLTCLGYRICLKRK